MTLEELTEAWDTLCEGSRAINDSRFKISVELLARLAQDLVPKAVTVYLESSDQGDHLALSSDWITDRDGNDHRAWPEPSNDNIDVAVEQAEQVCGWISCSDADYGVAPGWVVDDRRGGHYHIDIEEALR